TADSATPTPSPSETEEDEDDEEEWGDDPTPTNSPSRPGLDWEAIAPTPTSGPWPAYMLKPGDCFDMSKEREGHNEKISCSSAHDGEVVHQQKLAGEYKTDEDIRADADRICKSKLLAKAGLNSSMRFRNLSQYPRKSGYDLGMRTVTCSLVAQEGQKLNAKLN
ncbi:septum formation family protein, partial [Streptomyces alkaliterrae]